MIGATSGGQITWNLDVDDSKFKRGMASARHEADQTGTHVEKSGGAFEKLGSMAAAAAKTAAIALGAAATATVAFGIKSAASFEQTRIGLENMLGSADAARDMLAKVSKFAAETPFEFPELAQATRQLVAFGFSGDEAFKTMTQLGDVSAAIGAPIGDLAYLMGTLRAQGRAFTIDIRQFAMRGIPIYEYLAKVFKTNTQEVTKLIEAGKVGFPEVQKAFQLMTQEGGKFHGTMAKQSKSLSGLWSTLKDVVGQTTREMVGITATGDIREGSIFDRLRNGVGGLISSLEAVGPKISAAFNTIFTAAQVLLTGDFRHGMFGGQFYEDSAFIKGLVTARSLMVSLANFVRDLVANSFNALKRAVDFLDEAFIALFNTVIKDVFPTVKRLWNEVLKPLAPIILGVIVVAFKVWISVLNFWIAVIDTTMDVVLTVIYFFRNTLPDAVVVGAGLVADAFQRIVQGVINFKNSVVAEWQQLVSNIKQWIGILIFEFLRLPLTITYVFGIIAGSFVQFATETVPNFIMGVLNWFSQLPDRIGQAMSNMWQTVTGWFTRTKDSATTQTTQAVNTTVDTFQSLPSRIWQAIQGMWDKVSSGFIDFKNKAIQWGKDTVNGIIDSFTSLPGKIKDKVTGALDNAKNSVTGFFGDIGKSISGAWSSGSEAGHNAKGTDFWKGGPTWVGEEGPELLNLPRGSQIIPNDKLGTDLFTGSGSTSPAPSSGEGGGSYEYNIGTINISSEVDGERWLKKLTRNQEIIDNGLIPSRSAI